MSISTLSRGSAANDGTGTTARDGAIYINQAIALLNAMAPGLLYGLNTSNNSSDATNDIDFAIGCCGGSVAATFMQFASALTKRLDAGWAPGTNQGMRNSAAAITDTTYHLYAVCKADGADADFYAHTSASAATALAALQAESGGSAYVDARRIASIMRVSGAIVPYIQNGDLFIRDVPILDVNNTNPGTSAVLRTLSVPLGLNVRAIIVGGVTSTSTDAEFNSIITYPGQTDTAASSSVAQTTLRTLATAGAYRAYAVFDVLTDISARVRSRLSASDANTAHRIITRGWIDTRGK